jgi:scyllo-inositol 2-dehydrogenase (NADP+)
VDGVIVREKVETEKGNYLGYFEGVYQSIVNDQTEPVTAADGVNTMRVLEAAILSDSEKRVVSL